MPVRAGEQALPAAGAGGHLVPVRVPVLHLALQDDGARLEACAAAAHRWWVAQTLREGLLRLRHVQP